MIITFIVTFIDNHLCIKKKKYCNLNKQVHFKKGEIRDEYFLLIHKYKTYFYIYLSGVSEIRRIKVLF